MPEKTEGIVRANLERKLELSPTFASYYANDTQIQTTPWDVRFMFGMISDVDPESKRAIVERIADVRMSLPHAKRISEILVKQIQHYEATVGYIALPKDEK
jgi:hypothetical protein